MSMKHYLERQKNNVKRVEVNNYGYTVIDTDNEEDAIEQAKNMSDSDFDWSDFDDAQVVDNDVEWDESEDE